MDRNVKMLKTWLYGCAALVFAMVIVGAVTRLTESGLSITQWKPITGALPPLNTAQWQAEFALYQKSPEFQKEHFWMDLADFKLIYVWEWSHRLLGRVVGLVYALPLIFFWVRGLIPRGYKLPLLGLLFLGGLQGVVGWVMVQSGLVDEPSVSHYRLAAHLSLAVLIYALLIWTGLSLPPVQKNPDRALFIQGWAVVAIVAVTLLWGAFTAGLDAGLVYNESFPMMGGHWIPPELLSKSFSAGQLLENPVGVQFTHRWLAMLSLAAVTSFWLRAILRKNTFPALHAVMLMAVLQVGLGISTLMSGVMLPLAVLHQAGAVVLLTMLVVSLKRLQP